MKNIIRISESILLILSIFLINSCKEDKPTPPIVSTTAVSTISYTTAISGGDATNEGGAPIVSKGVCWNTSSQPTIDNNKTTESGGLGTFSSNLTSLAPNTQYYVRAYATNAAGTGYGDQVTFTTKQIEVPVLTTKEVTSITQTTAVSGGNITDDKGGSITARGVCWGTVTNPTIINSKTSDGSGTGSFVSSLTGLLPITTYYLRSYATNSVGTAYGSEISFTTNAFLVTGISLDFDSIGVFINRSKQLTASISPSNATNKNVTWNSTHSSVATVTSSGLISALELGTTTITATTEDGGYISSCKVTVIPYFSEVGKVYHAVDGLSVTLNSLLITETASSYRYSINYTLKNNTPDKSIDEGIFKMYYANKTGGLPQYGTFDKLFPGGIITRSYTFEELKNNPFGVLEYHHDNFFSNTPIDESLRWQVDVTNPATLPTVTTTNVSSITQNSVMSGGNVTYDGGSAIIARGVCWNTEFATPPSINDNKTTDGTGIGIFLSSITGLVPHTTYYLRAYATNSAGTNYGSKMQFFTTETTAIIFNSNLTYGTLTDIDNNVYKTIPVGTQVWMAENLKTTNYNDGTPIPQITDNQEWIYSTTPGYCWYNHDDPTYKNIYGALYNWYSVNTNKLCPSGWHVPNNNEWTQLQDYLGGLNIAGGKLKETGGNHWIDNDTNSNNESGFTALPGGMRENGGVFFHIGLLSYLWSSTDLGTNASKWYLQTNTISISSGSGSKTNGISVRCIKDN